ncbi:aminopeptidase P family protein [Alphaproteobacteria bacterium]|nr:aminopeptidase P family protein [Alphaproteobacteria bacterium]
MSTDQSSATAPTDALMRLRAELPAHNLDGWYVGREDMYQGEEVPPGEERLAYVSGFTGSAGFALVLADHAMLFSDGRYSLQMVDQCDNKQWSCHTLPDENLARVLTAHQQQAGLEAGFRIGIDPHLVTVAAFNRIAAAVSGCGGVLVAVSDNLVDAIWLDRPAMPAPKAVMMDDAIAGESADSKMAKLDAELDAAGGNAIILSRVDAVNWLVNMRGGDLPCTPVNLAFALYHRENGLIILADPGRLLVVMGAGYSVVPLALLPALIDPAAGYDRNTKILIELASLPYILHSQLAASGVELIDAPCPVTRLKAHKNKVELAGIRRAHIEDGAAMVRFLAWLDTGAASGMSESAIAGHLLDIRRQSANFIASSFDTICGSGPNGAIVHYRAIAGADRVLMNDNLLLVDSGAHYHDGTTDISRTIAIGQPDTAMRTAFTLVLKGHIALASARFPNDTNGVQLDVMARMPLWSAGMDYAHGTGHGVGHVLQVHEGPASISKRGNLALAPGMFLSNEPGYYSVGEWGIRIENLIAVNAPDDAGYLSFETVTKCPIDRRLIDPDLLDDSERDWVNSYHRDVEAVLSPLLDDDDKAWIEAACRPI